MPARMTGAAPRAFATATPRSPIGPGPVTTALSPATRPPQFRQPIHCRAGRHHQRCFLVRHAIGNSDECVDVVDLVLEAAVCSEAVGAVALVDIAVILSIIQARLHALSAAFALATAGMDFHADALTDRAFVDAGAERDDRAHIFVARREVLVERLATKDQGRRAVFDDYSDGVDFTRTSARFGTGTGLCVSLSSPGSPSTQAFTSSGIEKFGLVFTKGPEYIAASPLIRLSGVALLLADQQ